jgi:hypothetical protein
MTPETDPIQFPRQIWQTVSDLARSCLVRHAFCPEQSRIENLRCIRFESEKECKYGSQVWYFEAIGVDPASRRHMLYGVLDFSVQYGILEPIQAEVFEDSEHRHALFSLDETTAATSVWSHPSTRFWVRTAYAGVVVTSLMWLTMLALYFFGK